MYDMPVKYIIVSKGVVEIKSQTGEGGRGPDLKHNTELPYIAV